MEEKLWGGPQVAHSYLSDLPVILGLLSKGTTGTRSSLFKTYILRPTLVSKPKLSQPRWQEKLLRVQVAERTVNT